VRSLNKLDSRTIAIAVIAVSLLVAVLWYYLWYKPAQERILALEQEIQMLKEERDRGLEAKRNLPELRKKIAELEKEIEEFLAALPKEEKFYEVLELLSSSAKESDVTLTSLSRSPAQSEIADVASIDVAMNVEAPFPALYTFLKRLEELRRYSTINEVQLSLAKQDLKNPTISASLSARFYVYRGQPEETYGEGMEEMEEGGY